MAVADCTNQVVTCRLNIFSWSKQTKLSNILSNQINFLFQIFNFGWTKPFLINLLQPSILLQTSKQYKRRQQFFVNIRKFF